ncbi:MAG: L,D-transpeptidase [Nannocystaceae bacterium]
MTQPPVVEEPAQTHQPVLPPEPVATYLSPRTTVVYQRPAWGSPFRGRIDPEQAYSVYTLIPNGPDCEGDGWAKVVDGGYVCLERSEKVSTQVVQWPQLPEGQNTPFVYARPRQSRDGVLEADIPVYGSRWAYARQKEPISYLEGRRQYAFTESKAKFLTTANGKVVPKKNMRVYQPSAFQGRVLAENPVEPELRAGWSIRRRTWVYDRPSLRGGKKTGALRYHDQVDTRAQPVLSKGDVFAVIPEAGRDGGDGYVLADDIRSFIPGPKREGAQSDELWIDVDLDQQVLSVLRGEATEFVTLISSGAGRHPTPVGLYRISNKLAFAKMASRRDANANETYYVEAVPWIQYFHWRYALHASYWHNSFGRRRSHGCINLSPADARYVFDRTSPDLPPGLTSIYELRRDPGTVVRVRRGNVVIEDRRRSFAGEVSPVGSSPACAPEADCPAPAGSTDSPSEGTPATACVSPSGCPTTDESATRPESEGSSEPPRVESDSRQ